MGLHLQWLVASAPYKFVDTFGRGTYCHLRRQWLSSHSSSTSFCSWPIARAYSSAANLSPLQTPDGSADTYTQWSPLSEPGTNLPEKHELVGWPKASEVPPTSTTDSPRQSSNETLYSLLASAAFTQGQPLSGKEVAGIARILRFRNINNITEHNLMKSQALKVLPSQPEISLHKGPDIPKQLLAAHILELYSQRRLISDEVWAKALFMVARTQYRALRASIQPDNANVASVLYGQCASLSDLLRLWNLFFRLQQHVVPSRHFLLDDVVKHAANEMPEAAGYNHRLLAFAVTWPTGTHQQTDACLVLASFITLATLSQLRHRLASALDPCGSTQASSSGSEMGLLNIQQVSPSEAFFVHIVGRAGQGSPLNRIAVRIGLSRSGLTPDEVSDLSMYVQNVHLHADHLLEQVLGCLVSIRGAEDAVEEDERLNEGLEDPFEEDEQLNEGDESEEEDVSASPEEACEERSGPMNVGERRQEFSQALAPIREWIMRATPGELAVFCRGFEESSRDSIVDPGPSVLTALVKRSLAVERGLRETLHAWKISTTCALDSATRREVLLYARSKEKAGVNFRACVRLFLKCWLLIASVRWSRASTIELRDWLTDLWLNGQERQAITLYRSAVELIKRMDTQRQKLILKIANHMLFLCSHSEHSSQPHHARYFFKSIEKSGCEPSRATWRAWMRLSICTGDSKGFVTAFRSYNNMPGKFRRLVSESALYFRVRLSRIPLVARRTPIEVILTVISRAIRFRNAELSLERQYFQESDSLEGLDMERADPCAWDTMIEAHVALLSAISTPEPLPNAHKVTACLHEHLIRCVPREQLPQELIEKYKTFTQKIVEILSSAPSEMQTSLVTGEYFRSSTNQENMNFDIVKSEKMLEQWFADRIERKIGERPPAQTRHFFTLREHIEELLFSFKLKSPPWPAHQGTPEREQEVLEFLEAERMRALKREAKDEKDLTSHVHVPFRPVLDPVGPDDIRLQRAREKIEVQISRTRYQKRCDQT